MNLRQFVGGLSVAGLLLATGNLFAQSEYPVNRSRPWVDACERAIQDKVIGNNPRVQKVNFDQRSEMESQSTNNEMLMRGNGSFTRHNGEVEQFKFDCAYNTREGRIVRADYSVQESPSDISWDYMDDQSYTTVDPKTGWVQACHTAIRGDLKREHDKAETVRFTTSRERTLENSQNRVIGQGEFQKQDGDYRKFHYQCVYDMRQGRVVSSNYRLNQ